MTSTAASVAYVPQTQRQWQQLLRWVEANSAEISARKTAEYLAAATAVRTTMVSHFAQHPAKRGDECAWRKLGTHLAVQQLAEQYRIPVYMVRSDCSV